MQSHVITRHIEIAKNTGAKRVGALINLLLTGGAEWRRLVDNYKEKNRRLKW
jgi:hypothetical protein